jgi:hypothetical protein
MMAVNEIFAFAATTGPGHPNGSNWQAPMSLQVAVKPRDWSLYCLPEGRSRAASSYDDGDVPGCYGWGVHAAMARPTVGHPPIGWLELPSWSHGRCRRAGGPIPPLTRTRTEHRAAISWWHPLDPGGWLYSSRPGSRYQRYGHDCRSTVGKSMTDRDSGEIQRATYGTCHRCGWTGQVSRVGRGDRKLLNVGWAYGRLCSQCTTDLMRLAREPRAEGSKRSRVR